MPNCLVHSQQSIGMVDKPICTEEHVLSSNRKVNCQSFSLLINYPHLPSLKYFFSVSLKLLELFTKTFLWLSKV